jgi:hypothetical protein
MLISELRLTDDLSDKHPDVIASAYWKMASATAKLEEHAPMFFVVAGRRVVQLVAQDEFKDEAGKNRMSVLLRKMARGADVVIVIATAGRPSRFENSRELLSVLVQHRRFGSTFWSAEITNGPNGRTIGAVSTDRPVRYESRSRGVEASVSAGQV